MFLVHPHEPPNRRYGSSPAGIEDCIYATAAPPNSAPTARIAVGGDSAGGNMTAVTALRLRDEGGPALCGQLLLSGDRLLHAGHSLISGERREGYGLTRDTMKWFWDHYLSDPSEGAHPYASPLRAPDLSGLPPALLLKPDAWPVWLGEEPADEPQLKALLAPGQRARRQCQE